MNKLIIFILLFSFNVFAKENSLIKECNKNTINVLIIGDSISDGYVPFVKKAIGNYFYIHHRKTTTAFYTLEHLEDFLDDCPHWDVITWNNGAWDMSVIPPNPFPRGGPLPRYLGNLKKITKRLIQTNADIVFFNTTAVETFDDFVLGQLIDPWNEAAFLALEPYHIHLHDLNSWARFVAKHQIYGDIHYDDKGNEYNAELVIYAIRKLLP